MTVDLAQRPIELARRLALDGVEFVVVGGTARRLLGDPHAPRDLDVVVSDVDEVLRSVARWGSTAPTRGRAPFRLWTCLGPLDVFMGRTRAVRTVAVDGVDLLVAG